MSLPANTPVAEEAVDPSDIADFVIDLSPLLEDGEAFTQIDFAVAAYSVMLGFTILDTAPHQPAEIAFAKVRLWLTVDETYRTLIQWDGQGSTCGIEFTATTDAGQLSSAVSAFQ